MRSLPLPVVVLVVLGLVSPAAAESRIDILEIFDQFMISNAVASRCEKPDEQKAAKFLANMNTVRIFATKKLMQMSKDATEKTIDKAAVERYRRIDKAISDVIAREGCDAPQIKEARKRFDVQAEMNLFANSKSN